MGNRFVNSRHWEKGMTLIEVIVVLCLVSIVMGSMFLVLSRLNQHWKNVVSVETATNASELLLEELKDRITSDLALRRSGLEPKTQALSDFLGYDEADFKTQYHTERYTYEVVLWPLRELNLLEGSGFEIDLESVNELVSQPNDQARVLYSSNLSILEEEKFFSYTENQAICLKVEKEAATLLQIDEPPHKLSLGGVLDEKVHYEVVSTLQVKVKDELNVEEAIQIVEAEKNVKEHDTMQIGSISGWESITGGIDKKPFREFEIVVKASEKINERAINNQTTVKYLGKVQIDLSEVVKSRSIVEPLMSYCHYHFKIVNATGYDQVVQVIDNEPACQEEAMQVSFTLVNRADSFGQTGKSYLQTQRSSKNESYLIALWIGEVNPNKDGKCKVIKKMLDIYSYDPISKEGLINEGGL